MNRCFMKLSFTKVQMKIGLWCLGLILVVQGHVTAALNLSQSKTPDWWNVHQAIETQLLSEERNLVDWAAELLRESPNDIKTAFVKIQILLRAGLDTQAAEAIIQLKTFHPDLKQSSVVNGIYWRATDQQAWKSAQAVVETFPEQTTNIDIENRLIKHLRESGWDDEQVDQWIVEMQQLVAKVPQVDDDHWRYLHADLPMVFWLKLQVRQRKALDRKVEILKRLEQEVRQNPTEVSKMLDYLKVSYGVYPYRDLDKVDLSWIMNVFRPKKSTEAYEVAQGLMQLKQWSLASKLFRQAMDIPLADGERTRSSMMQQAMRSPGEGRARYQVEIREQLAKCLLKLCKSKEAQAMIAEAAEIRKKNHLHETLGLAAVVEAASGSQKVEQQILAEEKMSKNDPRYWQRRVRYYHSFNLATSDKNAAFNKKSIVKEEYAYKKGLEVAKPASRPRGKASMNIRASFLNGYACFMVQNKRLEEAFRLLLKEIKTSPADSWSSMMAVRLIASRQYRTLLDPNEPAFWKWLGRRPVWDYEESSLLNAMAEKTKGLALQQEFGPDDEAPERIYAFVDHVEKIARDADPSRAVYCAKLLGMSSRLGIKPNPERAISWLRYAMKHKDTGQALRWSAASVLFHAYLAKSDLAQAKKLFVDPKNHLQNRDRIGKFATLSAAQGDEDTAMKYWRRSANLGLTDKEQLNLNRQLRQLGLGDQIDACYREVKEKLSDFVSPAA